MPKHEYGSGVGTLAGTFFFLLFTGLFLHYCAEHLPEPFQDKNLNEGLKVVSSLAAASVGVIVLNSVARALKS